MTDFRNYTEGSFSFAKTTVIVGANGAGKTNLLEAIYFLATTKSVRANKNVEVIKKEKGFSRIDAKILKNDQEKKLSMVIMPTMKRLKINDVTKRTLDFLGNFYAVWFSPESLELIFGSPSLRRRFFDLLLMQTDHYYAAALTEYHKILAQRNHLLVKIKETGKGEEELSVWDEQLSRKATDIVEARQDAVLFLKEAIQKFYPIISGHSEVATVEYIKSKAGPFLKEELLAHRDAEIRSGVTLFGPHRDDFSFLLDGFAIASFGSRGEVRSIVLALKLAEKTWIERKTGQTPVILLDDAFSELDLDRRVNLMILAKNQQTIVTTAHLSLLPAEIQKEGFLVLEIANGRLKKGTA